jgi:prolyl oligopeptidase
MRVSTLALIGILGCSPAKAPIQIQPEVPVLKYPSAKQDNIMDNYHGTEVADPYRWLEDPDSESTREWVNAQNDLSRSWLEGIPHRKPIRERLTTLWNNERFGVPNERGGRYFYTYNDGLKNQPVLYSAPDWQSEGEVLLDVNDFSEDGTVALSGYAISKDAKYLAYGLSDGGSDWVTYRVREVATGEDLSDTIRWVKFSGADWAPDGSGFYYSRYPEPTEDKEEALFHQKVYFHTLGTPQAEDRLIYERPDEPDMGFGASVTDDAAYLLIHVWQGTEEKSRVYYRPLADEQGEFIRYLDKLDANYRVLGHRDGQFIITTDLDAPKRRVIAMPVDDATVIKEIVAEQDHALQSTKLVGDHLVLEYLVDAKSELRLLNLEDMTTRNVPLPALGSAGGFSGKQQGSEFFYWFTSPVHPTQIYRYDLKTDETMGFRKPSLAINTDDFVVKQVFVTSKDGTKIPLMIAHRADIEWDGSNPTLLYGYGGFNIPITPSFSAQNLVWMELGGVYASASLRGGGEYGRDWHLAGTKQNKQNVFDDFIASAEWLIEQQVTAPKHLGIYGRSNGGLLAAATVLQRPDLFGAAIPAVGVLDMMRYHKFTIGWAWASDYGTSDESEMIEPLMAYSPVHNVDAEANYPAILVTTADHDDRVVPAHSYKFTATLQAAQQGIANPKRPSLIRIETRAGHGAGKSVQAVIDESTDMWGFLAGTLGVPLENAQALTETSESP